MYWTCLNKIIMTRDVWGWWWCTNGKGSISIPIEVIGFYEIDRDMRRYL